MTVAKRNNIAILFGRKDKGLGTLVNHTDGGDGMYGYKFSEENKKLMSIRVSGKDNPNYANYWNDDKKEFNRQKTKDWHKTHISPLKGKAPWNKGLTISDPRIAKLTVRVQSTKRNNKLKKAA